MKLFAKVISFLCIVVLSVSAYSAERTFYNLKGSNFSASLYINDIHVEEIDIDGRGNAQGNLSKYIVNGDNEISVTVKRHDQSTEADVSLQVLLLDDDSNIIETLVDEAESLDKSIRKISYQWQSKYGKNKDSLESQEFKLDKKSEEIILDLARRYIRAYKERDIPKILTLEHHRLIKLAKEMDQDVVSLEKDIFEFLEKELTAELIFDDSNLDEIKIQAGEEVGLFKVTRSDNSKLIQLGDDKDGLTDGVAVKRILVDGEHQWQIYY